MNSAELGRKITDKMLEKQIEGTVRAVLPSDPLSDRYAVETTEGIIDARVERFGRTIYPFCTPYLKPRLRQGDPIKDRTISATPWIDGQIVG